MNLKKLDDVIIQDYFIELFPPVRNSNVALYNSIAGEVDTGRIYSVYKEASVNLYFPRTINDEIIEFYPDGDFEIGRFNIFEPKISNGEKSEDFMIILVPGRSFDARGWRHGRGWGYYDRFIERLPVTTLLASLAYAEQVVPQLIVQPWDKRMDVIITEEGVIYSR